MQHVCDCSSTAVGLNKRNAACADMHLSTPTPAKRRGAVNSDGLSSPEQFGVWEVDGVGLCVAFRGTASTEDVLIDVNITPTPLETSRNMRGEQDSAFSSGSRVGLGQACGPQQRVMLADITSVPLETSLNMRGVSGLRVQHQTLLEAMQRQHARCGRMMALEHKAGCKTRDKV